MSEPEKYENINSVEELAILAEGFGCSLVVAKSNELLLDIDWVSMRSLEGKLDQWKEEGYAQTLDLIAKRFRGAKIVDFWNSRTSGLHIHIQLGQDIVEEAAFALQACLGSDPKREIMGLWELKDPEREYGTITRSLFRPKEVR